MHANESNRHRAGDVYKRQRRGCAPRGRTNDDHGHFHLPHPAGPGGTPRARHVRRGGGPVSYTHLRAGAGGDEAGLFGAELVRMYQHYAEKHGWKVEMTDEGETEIGGIKEAVMLVQDVYKRQDQRGAFWLVAQP